MRHFNSSEHKALYDFGITINDESRTKNNHIYVSEELLVKNTEKLRVKFIGEGNNLIIKGNDIPIGSILFRDDGAYCELNRKNDLNIDFVLYKNSRIIIKDSYSIFGIFISAYINTSVTIGKNCLISDGVEIWTSDHHSVIDLSSKKQINYPQDVVINDRVWIGRGVYIGKGVNIGHGSIIAARALVSKNVPKTEVWGGVPAKCIKKNVSWVASEPANKDDIEDMMRDVVVV